MSITRQAALACLGLSACAMPASAQAVSPLQTRAERTRFEETTPYNEVRAFMDALAARTGRARVESFGRSEEGRDLPLLVVGDPPAPGPAEARASRRPVVLVMGNIHAGEVEGKEALLHLARDLTTGDLQPLLNGAIWLFAPIYNADGNEKVSVENRPEQHGPIAGVGTRENASGLDLNRDFMKLESAEARALVGLLTRWDPDVVVDLHTTNGSHHGYHLTYSPTLNPNADARLIAYARERLLPAVRDAVSTRHAFRTYYYGNFDEDGTRAWRTFDHRPRFGNNYVGLRNRIAILSEAYSYLDFAGRVRVTEAFVEEVMRYVVANASEIRALVSRLDDEWTSGASPGQAGVAFEIRPLPEPVDILVGAVQKKANPRSGKTMIAMIESAATPARMMDYGVFAATRSRRVPREYLVLPTAAGGVHQAIAARLKQHGVRVDELPAAMPVTVERFVIGQVRHAAQSFQGHRETTIAGRYEKATVPAPGGTLVVRTNQPLGSLVFYLLEPESDDGLTTWNVVDAALTPGGAHPVLKTLPGQPLQTRPRP